MSTVAHWFHIDVRSRWRSLLALALLIAFASATVMTAVAGARRGATAVDRLNERTLPVTVAVLANDPEFDWDVVRRLPNVAALSEFVIAGFGVEQVPAEDQATIAAFPPADDEVLRTIERPVVLEGRVAAPDRADEVMVSPSFEDRYGRGVGDSITLRLFSPEQMDSFLTGGDLTEPGGPTVEATITGVILSPWFSEPAGAESATVIPSSGLFEEHRLNFAGAEELNYINALVRLDGDAADVARFKVDLAEATGRSDIDLMERSDADRHDRDVTRFEANSLLAFALAAAVAALFLVGQSITRLAAATAADLEVIQAFGLTTRQSRLASAVGPTVAAGLGVGLGMVAAAVASQWFPIGTAARFEPTPGWEVDGVVFGAAALLPLVVGGAAALAAGFWLRARDRVLLRPSAIVSWAARVGARASLTIGARFALEPGRGRRTVPVRPALAGAIVGVLGVIAALTFSSGVHDAAGNLERFGQTSELTTFFGFNGTDFAPVDDTMAALEGEDDVTSVQDVRNGVVQAGEVSFEVFSYEDDGSAPDVVVTDGRMPTGDTQVALAPRTAEALDASVGDSFPIEGAEGPMRLTVTGIAFVPALSHNDYATGAWIPDGSFEALAGDFKFHVGFVSLRDGADPEAVAARIGEEYDIDLEAVTPPPEIAELREVQSLPLLLAVFLGVLALGAVGHALATAVRRRRHDLAALRAIGMTGFQTRSIVLTQATLLAVVGLVVGLPVGVGLGRSLWRHVAEQTPLEYFPPLALLALLLIVPAALLLANLLAAVPSHRAASMNVGHSLRTE